MKLFNKARELAEKMLRESHKTISEANSMLRKENERLKKGYEEEAIIWQTELTNLTAKFQLITTQSN